VAAGRDAARDRKKMDTPCCDVFELVGDEIKRFDCYPEGTITLTQLGVLGNLGSALTAPA
jgi:hypothetical protein